MACKHCISFATNLAANLVALDSESCLTSFPSFCAPPSEVAALFNSNLSRHRRPFGLSSDRSLIQTCCFAQDWIWNMLICRQQLLADSKNILFHMKKKSDLLLPKIYKALKPCWLLNWVSITRVVFFSSEQVTALSDCSWLRNSLCLCSAVRPAQAELESCPKRPESCLKSPRINGRWPLILTFLRLMPSTAP